MSYIWRKKDQLALTYFLELLLVQLRSLMGNYKSLFLFLFIHSSFPHQVSHSLLLLLSKKGCRDFPAQPSGINIEEHQRVAHQPETAQQECDSRVWC